MFNLRGLFWLQLEHNFSIQTCRMLLCLNSFINTKYLPYAQIEDKYKGKTLYMRNFAECDDLYLSIAQQLLFIGFIGKKL